MGPWVATEKDGLTPMEEMPGPITRQWVRRGTQPCYRRSGAEPEQDQSKRAVSNAGYADHG
jgi:hypothetical protein